MLKVVFRNIIYTILLPIIPIVFGFIILAAYLDGPIIVTLLERIPVSVEFTILPIILGLIAGILLGILSVKVRYKLIKLLIQILTILGISMPVFFVGMWFQFAFGYQLELFPVLGDPTLPSLILFLSTLFLTTRQVRSNYLKKSEEKHILSNSLQVIFNLSIIYTNILLLELIFNLHGFFRVIFHVFINYELFRVSIFILFVLFAIILFLSNTVYTIYNFFSEESQSQIFTKYLGRTEQVVEEHASYTLNPDQKFKAFIISRLKSPLTIIGLALVAFTTIVTIFPQVLTPLTLDQAIDFYPGPWEPPSATHPLGTTKFGRDVLALLAYGVSTSIKVCILPVLIGIAIGLLFGYLCKVHRWIKGLILGFMVISFIAPSIMVILLYLELFERNITIILSIMAMYVIPWVTLLISKGNYSLKLTATKVITYFPLFMAFNILLFEALSFIGFTDLPVQLGSDIGNARINMFLAPWAFLWPGLTLYASVIGFLMLHYGLKEPIPIFSRSRKF